MPLSLSHLESHPGLYLGPGLVSLALEALQTGILINQSLTFWERSERERAVVRWLVVFVSSVAFLQTALRFYTAWHVLVDGFGDWVASVNFIWADKMQSTTTAAMAAPVQGFLIWRCWTLFDRRFSVLFTLSTLLLASVISSIIVTSDTFKYKFGVVFQADPSAPLPKVPINITFILSLACSAVLDVILTGILLAFLMRSKQHITSSRFRRILKRLTVLIWEAALPPCICAVLTAVTYLTLVNDNYWDLTFQAILGKLYVISLFVTLNGRAELQNGPVSGWSGNHGANIAWSASAPIRVSIAPDPEAGRSLPLSNREEESLTETPVDSEPSRDGTPSSRDPRKLCSMVSLASSRSQPLAPR